MAQLAPSKLIYEGSVKRVWQAPNNDERLWFEFTDDYSVFDWGKMPDKITNKGKALAIMGAYLFERLHDSQFWKSLPQSPHLAKFDQQWLSDRWSHPVFLASDGLSQRGALTHFTGLIADGQLINDLNIAARSSKQLYMEVLRAEVGRPAAHEVLSQKVYFYPASSSREQTGCETQITDCRRLVGLEIVFRFGMPAGSSLRERLIANPSYAKVLGLKSVPEVEPNQQHWLEHPVIEFFTKLEEKDRLLSLQEAALIAQLNGEQFERMTELAFDVALALYVIFAERKMELWDGKIELVHSTAGSGLSNLLIADSIGPDELRILYDGCHLSKELFRQHYRGSAWETALKEAQSIAKFAAGRNWKQIINEDLKVEPEPLPSAFKTVADRLYGVIVNQLVGEVVFPNHPSLNDFTSSLPSNFAAPVSPS